MFWKFQSVDKTRFQEDGMSVSVKSSEKRRQVVFLFNEDTASDARRLGGKGAGLVELTKLGLPVPPGFTVSTTVARAFSEHGRLPRRTALQMNRGLKSVEQATGRRFGDVESPLLVSVRSGAAVSMPGMMDTVLNVGLNPDTVQGLGRQAGWRFAFDSYARFLRQFGETVLGVERACFDEVDALATGESSVSDVETICQLYRQVIEVETGRPVPDSPLEQIALAVLAVLASWDSERAAVYREAHGIPHWWGTAVNIQAMVFGNRGQSSCTGVVFSRDVRTGAPGLYGEFLPNAQGEDIVSGSRTPMPIQALADWNIGVYTELVESVEKLEGHFSDIVDVEFTVEEGKLFLLQCRKAQRSAQAAASYAVQKVWAGEWTRERALEAVSADQVEELARPGFEPEALAEAVTNRLFVWGLAASPGAAVGAAVFSSAKAKQLAATGEKIILVRPDTAPEDLPGMLASVAVVTAVGGETSHAAVVARGIGKPAVVGCAGLTVGATWAKIGEVIVRNGDVLSVDGSTGVVVLGEVPLVQNTQTKEVRIFLSWVERFGVDRKVEPRIGFEYVGQQFWANTLLNDFYLVDAMARASRGTVIAQEASKLQREVQVRVAEILACYLTVAVAGEVRHVHYKALISSMEAQVACQKLAAYGVKFGGHRCDTQYASLQSLKARTLAEQIEFARLSVVVYEQASWEASYGGGRWAAIARALHGFLSGELSHMVFVDHVWDLRHNGGTLFDKHELVIAKEDRLVNQLNAKKAVTGGPIELRCALGSSWDSFSPEVRAMYERGNNQGLWG